MKNKLFQKVISCSVAAILIAGLFAGCGNADTESKESSSSSKSSVTSSSASDSSSQTDSSSKSGQTSTDAGVTYPIDTDVTLTIAIPPNNAIKAHWTDISETQWFAEWEKQTGVNIEIMQMEEDALKLMLLGDDMPDIVWGLISYLPGSPEASIEDGIIEPLTDYIDEYMPDYKAALEKYDILRKSMTTPAGDVYGAGTIFDEPDAPITARGIFLRKDWLEELNLEVPETADEFYEVAKAFYETKGASIGGSLGGFIGGFMNGQITDAFGLVKAGWYHIDGVVHYGYAESEMKEVFAYINKLYTEGLIDQEIVTIDSNTIRNKLSESKVSIASGYSANVDSYREMVKAVDPNTTCEWVGIPNLVKEKGTVARGADTAGQMVSNMMFVTTACEYPELAAQLLNYGYTEQGHTLMNYGIEGVSYEIKNGSPLIISDVYTTFPEGITTYSVVQADYVRASEVRMPSVISSDYLVQYRDVVMSDNKKVTEERWQQTSWGDHCISPFASALMSVEEADEFSKISGEINTYTKEMLAAYMTGTKSLDTFETEYLATLKSLGVDRMIEIYQKAFDTFNAN